LSDHFGTTARLSSEFQKARHTLADPQGFGRNSTAEVLAAQHALAAAEQRQKDERHTQLVEQLESTTNLLEQQKVEYQALRQRVLTLRARRKKLQNALTVLLGQEAEHGAARPRHADYLPNDKSVVEWNKSGERLAAQRAAISRELAETSIVSTMHVDLVRLGAEIQRLEYAQGNLVTALESLKPKPFLSPIEAAPAGGLSRVQWR
jgi:chromosome segregation ATPase